jgi:hypothetical protein
MADVRLHDQRWEGLMPKLIWILLLLVLSGCATVGVETVEQLRPGTKIVPLSLMGDKLAIRHIGTLVFQNERRDLDVASWQIDTYAEGTAARVMREGGKFSPTQVDTTAARRSVGKLGHDFWTSAAVIEGGPQSVIGLAQQAGAEYVLVIAPSQLGDPFFGTNQSFSGYGIGQRSFLTSKRGVNYLTMRVVLLDAKDGKEVARTHDFLSSARATTDWMESDNLSLTESNAVSTRLAIESLIDRVLSKGLTDLKLVR